jgi:hypothetical protein
MRESHLVSVNVSAKLLAEFITRQALMDDDRSVRPFPDDVRYVRAFYDPEIDVIVIVLEHPSFPRTPECAHIMRVGAVMHQPQMIEHDGFSRGLSNA